MHRTLTALAALTLSLFIGGAAMAQTDQTNTETEIRNKATVQASFDAWRAGQGGPFDLLTEDATWTIVGQSDASKTYPTKAAFLSEVIGPFNARMSVGIKPTIREIHADGDTVVIFFDATGTARDGKSYANTYAWFFHMRDGKVIKASAFFDSVVFNDLWRRVTPLAQD